MSTALVRNAHAERQPTRRNTKSYGYSLAGIESWVDLAIFDLSDGLKRHTGCIRQLAKRSSKLCALLAKPRTCAQVERLKFAPTGNRLRRVVGQCLFDPARLKLQLALITKCQPASRNSERACYSLNSSKSRHVGRAFY